MTAKNAEGYPDPTAEEAIRHVMRGGKLDYTSFRTYEELQDYTIEHNKGISTREAADKFIREKMPKESHFQKKILDWIKDNAPNAIAWKEAAGPYSRQGIPDITCIINGRYYGFEVKRPFIGVLSKMQEQTIKQIRKAGGRAWVVTSEKEVAEILLPEEKVDEFGDSRMVCPNCGHAAIANLYRKCREIYPYCPWCGQKLQEVQDETEKENQQAK